ncbi:phospholipase D-like domain-containing protein [Terrimonas sp. NA20]|uniref:phospholipase D n=1 Tax=Terrimonas ginsenosidimutans TaxID=2908004 RepID=A0ABS9KM36_9BACT|nr:phospholipase D-like domain-containing protein [Terrimonas ginsenosidimutans]MCG2613387.1 phospholipase D-like domain-containing protein [Terrimonas ginsenosidimutans]
MSQKDFQVVGTNSQALFTLKIHRGDGMALIAMNWKNSKKPPKDFVGFAIEYKEPGGDKYFALSNRISFKDSGVVSASRKSSLLSPFQKFRWVHFPMNPEKKGLYTYKVTPVFMDKDDQLTYGKSQQAKLQLRRETYPKQLNIAYTRGFVSSQAFAERYCSTNEEVNTLIPGSSKEGIRFQPTHPKSGEALAWMGFEARQVINDLLDQAIADQTAQVKVIAYDLSEGSIVRKLEKLGNRLKIIIDNDGDHGETGSGENQAEKILKLSAGNENVIRQHAGGLQHNKMIIVDGKKIRAALGGSTNYSWRGLFVQSNNAVVVHGEKAIKPFAVAFENYWLQGDGVSVFAKSSSAEWSDLGLTGIKAKVCFSPHNTANSVLDKIAQDINAVNSSLFFSLAFLNQTPGTIKEAIKQIKDDDQIFCYGLADKKVGGLELTRPDGKTSVVSPTALKKNLPTAFKREVDGGSGVRMHHKFLVLDFNKPSARVYTGSYNFSKAADGKNGENLWLIEDRRIATSYAIASLAMFDHYHFRVIQEQAAKARMEIVLSKPPRTAAEKAWWEEDYTNTRKIMDRKLFA